MNQKQKLFQELIFFANEYLRHRDYFVCIYGSYVSGHYTEVSDMDMFIAVKDHEVKDFEKVRDFLIDLHIRYGLNLDDEVPYENKLMVSYEDIQHAVALRPFIKKGARYYVPPIEKKKGFLESKEIRWRLVLNALTSPHECVCGNKKIHTVFKSDAEKSITRLAHGLVEANEPTADEVLEALISGANGEEGEMYLGYKKERDSVTKYLQELILRNYPFNT